MSEVETNNSPVPSSQDVFQEAFNAAMGGSVEPTETEQSVDLQDSIDSGIEADESSEVSIDGEPEGQEQELSETDENSTELSENVEEVAVKGKDGKRKNIKVDFSDKDKLKKYVQKAANAVRLQSERDALQAKVGKLEEAQTAMNSLQEIVDTKGFEGLIDHLNSDNGGFKAWMDQKVARHEQRLHASEDELARLDAEDKAAELQRRLERIEQQEQSREERLSEERNQVELDKLASQVNPVYFKYTFDGKLGDSVAEQRHNKAMFREVTETLDNLREEGVQITPAVIEREFKAYASPLLKGVNRKVRQNTKRAIDKKKAEATTHAQQQVRRGYNTDTVDQAMSSRNWTKSLADLWVKGKL